MTKVPRITSADHPGEPGRPGWWITRDPGFPPELHGAIRKAIPSGERIILRHEDKSERGWWVARLHRSTIHSILLAHLPAYEEDVDGKVITYGRGGTNTVQGSLF